MLHWLAVCLLLLVGNVLAFESNVNVTYTTVPSCTTDCVISAFVEGVASCPNALDTACTCDDHVYKEWVTVCVRANCTVKESIISANIDARQCGVGLRPHPIVVVVGMYGLYALASVLMLLRVVVKLMGHGGGWGWDDWLIVPAYALLCVMFGISVYLIDIAFGHNMWDISFGNISRGLEFFWIADLAYTALISLTKLSMCFFFLRIFGHSRAFRKWANGVIVANLVVWLVFQPMVTFQCRPVSAFWSYWTGEIDGEYYCFSLYSFALGQAVVSIVMDIVMISLPIHETMKVKLSIRKKIGVVVMFGMGFGWTIIGIVRAVAIWHSRVITNITVDMAPLGYWTDFESCVAVICACLPDSRFFFSRLIPKTFGWNSTKDSGKSPYQLTDLSARSARQKAMRVKAGMISVTTEFELNSVNPGSFELLTDAVPAWEQRRDTAAAEAADADKQWPLRPAPSHV